MGGQGISAKQAHGCNLRSMIHAKASRPPAWTMAGPPANKTLPDPRVLFPVLFDRFSSAWRHLGDDMAVMDVRKKPCASMKAEHIAFGWAF